MTQYIHVGTVTMRDAVTGDFNGESVPLYARAKSGISTEATTGENITLKIGASIYYDIYKTLHNLNLHSKEQE